MSTRKNFFSKFIAAAVLAGLSHSCPAALEIGDQVKMDTCFYSVDNVCYAVCYGLDSRGQVTFVAWESLPGGGPSTLLKITIAGEPSKSTAIATREGKKLLLNDSHTIVECAAGAVSEMDFPEGKALTEEVLYKYLANKPKIEAKKIAGLFR